MDNVVRKAMETIANACKKWEAEQAREWEKDDPPGMDFWQARAAALEGKEICYFGKHIEEDIVFKFDKMWFEKRTDGTWRLVDKFFAKDIERTDWQIHKPTTCPTCGREKEE